MSEGSAVRKLLGERLGERFEKCAKWWVMATAGVAGTIAAGIAANAQWENFRPWATRGEIGQVADRTYPTALANQQRLTLSLQDRLDWLRERAKAGKLTPTQWGEIAIIEGAIERSKKEEEQIIKEQTKFKSYQEYR